MKVFVFVFEIPLKVFVFVFKYFSMYLTTCLHITIGQPPSTTTCNRLALLDLILLNVL